MPKINWKRKKVWIVKTPVTKVNKIQQPESIYNRKKEKELLREALTNGEIDAKNI